MLTCNRCQCSKEVMVKYRVPIASNHDYTETKLVWSWLHWNIVTNLSLFSCLFATGVSALGRHSQSSVLQGSYGEVQSVHRQWPRLHRNKAGGWHTDPWVQPHASGGHRQNQAGAPGFLRYRLHHLLCLRQTGGHGWWSQTRQAHHKGWFMYKVESIYHSMPLGNLNSLSKVWSCWI